MEQEIWKDVVGYEGHYEVSNMGRVKRLPRSQMRNYKTGLKLVCYAEKVLNLSNACYGSKMVGLSINGNYQTCQVHRLVAAAFIPNPEAKPCVNHIDFDRANNTASNLEWCTHKENTNHSMIHGRWGDHSAMSGQSASKLQAADVIHIRLKALPRKKYAAIYNVAPCHISNLQNPKIRGVWDGAWTEETIKICSQNKK